MTDLEALLVALLVFGLWTVSLGLFLSGWLYEGKLPGPRAILDDLHALRAMLLILHTGDDALQQMLAEAQRHES